MRIFSQLQAFGLAAFYDGAAELRAPKWGPSVWMTGRVPDKRRACTIHCWKNNS